MIKKTITFENPFTSLKTTEDFWFHISKAEFVRMDVEEHDQVYQAKDGKEYTGMLAKLHRIMEAQDGKAMMPVFEDMIRRSVGRKDGDRFHRSDEIWEDFKGRGVLDELLFELCTQPEAAGDWVNGAMPSNLAELAEETRRQAAEQESTTEPVGPNRAARRAKKKPAARKPAEATEQLENNERSAEIAAATTENPAILTTEEMVAMEPEDLQTGLASGKFKLA